MLYEVDTQNGVACKLFCKFAHANGWRGSMYADPTYVERFSWLVLDVEDKLIAGNTCSRGNKIVDMDTAIDIVLNPEEYYAQNLVLDDVTIDGNTPEITPDGDLIVGCQTIPHATVCLIYHSIINYKNETQRKRSPDSFN